MRYALLILLIPFVALAGWNMAELSISSVTNAQLATDSAGIYRGKVQAVHVEVTPTSGTWTNTVTLSTTANKGISFKDDAILTLTGLKGTTNYIYYPRFVSDDNTGTDVVATNGWYNPYYLLGDTLKLTVTNTSAASTNGIVVRVLIED